MMRVYIFQANWNVFQPLRLAVSEVLPIYRKFNGSPLAETITLPVDRLEEDERWLVGDFPGLTSHIPCFSQRAVDLLEAELAALGGLHPLQDQETHDRFYALNVTRLVDALDLDHAVVKRFASSGRIMRILSYAFYPEKLAGLMLFKIPETALQAVYATNAFVDLISASGLRGGVFKLVWTNESPLLLCPYCSGLIAEDTAACPTCGLDTRNDAPWEVSAAELFEMKCRPCSYCSTRIRTWADPCPFCLRGKTRTGKDGKMAVV